MYQVSGVLTLSLMLSKRSYFHLSLSLTILQLLTHILSFSSLPTICCGNKGGILISSLTVSNILCTNHSFMDLQDYRIFYIRTALLKFLSVSKTRAYSESYSVAKVREKIIYTILESSNYFNILKPKFTPKSLL